MDISVLMGNIIRLATLLSPAHARAVSEYMLDNVVTLPAGRQSEDAIVRILAQITTEMLAGPIQLAEFMGATAVITVVENDGEEIAQREYAFDGVKFTDDGFRFV